MSRSTRFLSGVGVGYLNQAVVMLLGLWLTPLYLRHAGAHDYGLWLSGMQLVGYLLLLDTGITMLLPREVAFALGRSGGRTDTGEIARLLGQLGRIVLWQTPLVGLAALILWTLLPPHWSALKSPLAVVFAVFTALYPLRLLNASLFGLQEMAFQGWLQISSWIVNAAVSVAGLLAGWGLLALTAGWLAGHLVTSLGCLWRVASRYPHLIPRSLPELPRTDLKRFLSQGLWISVAQVAQLFLAGTDLLIIGGVLGPEAAVAYSCTAKLVSVLSNQPQILMQSAAPAMCELRAAGETARLRAATSGLALAMMSLAGLVACVVLAGNELFVRIWVGPGNFGGRLLESLLGAAMMFRLWNVVHVYTLFCHGMERRVSVTTLMDGAVTVASMYLFTRWVGLAGGPLGSLAGVCLVSLPRNARLLARVTGVPYRANFTGLGAWLWRFALCAAGAWLAHSWAAGSHPLAQAALAAAVCAVYAALLAPLFLKGPLAAYTVPRVNAVWARLTGRPPIPYAS